MQFPDSFFEDEVRDGFFVPGLMKHSWAAQMEILADIDKVCKKHNIRWFADSGTLLGAIRHKGYIPWDDDVDICMLRDDYTRFLAVAEEELPEGYYIPKNRDAGRWMFTSVYNGSSSSLDKEYLKKFHGFPFCTFIDIFVLDYIAPNPEDEKFRIRLAEILIAAAMAVNNNTKSAQEIESMLEQVEDLLHIQLVRDATLQKQLFDLAEQAFSMYTDKGGTEVACMPIWISRRAWKFPLKCFQETALLPFECMEINVPKDYLTVVRLQYGENYMQPYRGGSSHEYPSYRKLEAISAESSTETANLLSRYWFSKNDLERPQWKGDGIRPDKIAINCIQDIRNIHQQLSPAMNTRDIPCAFKLLETGQTIAIHIGTVLEQSKGEGFSTIKLLEEYCEHLYQICEALTKSSSYTDIDSQEDACIHPLYSQDADSIVSFLDQLLNRIENDIKNNVRHRKEVVFLPFKASAWKSLEPVWKQAKANPDYDVYVIPIPYYYKSLTEDFATLYYEGSAFPEYVPVTDYKAYDFETRQPDVIFFHNPYDNCSFTTSVHPFFYSSNLKQYTGQLIYIPYFQTDEIMPDDMPSIYNLRYYVTVPGLIHADKVILQSGQMRQTYIDCLTEFAGEDTRSLWEEKITDCSLLTCEEELPHAIS